MPPPLAERAEQCRRAALDWLFAHDYRLFAPPLAEHLETLTAGDKTLDADTFKMTDTLSGETLGLRADHTQQVLRYDKAAGGEGVRRYCYCGPVIRAHPPQAWKLREEMQLGAEIFGAGGEGDKGLDGGLEIARITAGMLRAIGITNAAASIANVGIVRELLRDVKSEKHKELLHHFVRKDAAGVNAIKGGGMLAKLCAIAGGGDAIDEARRLLPARLSPMIDEVEVLLQVLSADGGDAEADFSDIGGYGYHTGAVFVFYGAGFVAARGGVFSHGAGFSTNLREVAEHLPPQTNDGAENVVSCPLNAAAAASAQWRRAVDSLEKAGRRLRFVNSGNPPPPCLQKDASGKWQVREVGKARGQ